jgi:hypothetical protein
MKIIKMNKITPVEWLVQQMENQQYFIGNELYSAIEEAKRMEQAKYEKVTRFEVIDHTVEFGRLYTKHNCMVELQLQDEDRTLKAFISARRTKLDIFVERLKKVGVEVTLAGNYPWIYLDKINGTRVTETFRGNHGFTIAFLPIQEGVELQFTDIGKIFKLIRKYVKYEKRN